jgi:hypothetical protein
MAVDVIPLIFKLGTTSIWVVNPTLHLFYSREVTALSIVKKAWYASGPVWTDMERR